LIYELLSSGAGELTRSSGDPKTFFRHMVPDELLRYVSRGSYSLLIKGAAGTGKTSLALTLLNLLPKDVNFLYLSTRASPAQLYVDHPWLSESLGQKKGARASPAKGRVSREFIDARLDEPGPLFEKITSELMDVRAPMIVIDTWDPLEDYIDFPELQVNIKVLQTWRERAGGKLILTGENPNDSTLDSLVDGVVVLRQGELETRRIREIVLSKLHGTNISNPLYSFTLNGGVFRSFPRVGLGDLLAAGRVSAWGKPGLSRQRIGAGELASTGYSELDSVLGGGLAIGSAASITLDPGVDARMAMVFLGPTIADFVLGGNPTMILPWQGANKEFVDAFLKHLVPSAGSDAVNLFWPRSTSKKSKVKRGMKLKPEPLRRLASHAQLMEKRNPKEAKLALIFLDSVLAPEGEEGTIDLSDISTLAQSDSCLVILLVRGALKLPARIMQVTETRMKLIYQNGSLLVVPESPFSHLYAVTPSLGEKGHPIDVEPLV
jgi:KaiC/GvpD/RAD55 family RecA-like ATPase